MFNNHKNKVLGPNFLKESSFVVDLRKNQNSQPENVFVKNKKEDAPKKKTKLVLEEKNIFQSSKNLNKINFKPKLFSFSENTKIKKEKIKIGVILKDFWHNKKKLFKKPKLNFFKELKDALFFYKKKKSRHQILITYFQEKRKIFSFLPKIKTKKTKFRWHIPVAYHFLIILVILIVPIKILSSFGFFNFSKLENSIMNKSTSALNSLMAAADSVSSFDFFTANQEFGKASSDFLAAENELSKISDSIFTLASLSKDPKLQLASQGRKFLSAGASASSLGANLISATEHLFSGRDNFSESLDAFLESGKKASNDAKDLKKILNEIDVNSLPVEYRDKFIFLKKQVALLADNLGGLIDTGNNLKDLLGLSRDKRYLLVFQNNAELRASGGFLGSYALVDIRDGKVRNLEVPAGGSYDLEAGLKGKKIVSPEPLWLVNPHWNFWDANWWPDWPKTAKNLMWFYEESGGPTVDGVISLTPSVVEKVLKITGPIDMSEEYGLIIDADNFWESVQVAVEYDNLNLSHPELISEFPDIKEKKDIVLESDSFSLKQDLENNPDNKPKKIIGDLMAKILTVLPEKLSKENLYLVSTLFEESVSEKHILFYFKDDKFQNEIINRGLGGEIKNSDYDYLMIVDTNIAGQKTNKILVRESDLKTEIDEDGYLINTLHIKYRHYGQKGQAMTGVRNVNWLRVYVPYGSQLIEASGFSVPDISFFEEPEEGAIELPALALEKTAFVHSESGVKVYDDSGKTVFANWTMTDPGHETDVFITYRLPFNFYDLRDNTTNNNWLKKISLKLNPDQKLAFPYSLLVQKQPGLKPFDFKASFYSDNEFEVFWKPENDKENFLENIIWDFSGKIGSDKFFPVLVK